MIPNSLALRRLCAGLPLLIRGGVFAALLMLQAASAATLLSACQPETLGADARTGSVTEQDGQIAPADADASSSDIDGGPKPTCTSESDCPVAQDPCRTALCQQGKCLVGSKPNDSTCEDGDQCSVGDTCKDGSCKAGAPKACDDKNPCTQDLCDPSSGNCSAKSLEGQGCDDGDLCTADDKCAGNTCKGTLNKAKCECLGDSDCPDDDNLCNGAPFCDPATHKCTLLPSSVVDCKAKDDNPDDCLVLTCNPASGKCEEKFAAKGAACVADDLQCTKNESCDDKGVCKVGTDLCECTTDQKCQDKFSSANPCNGQYYCNKDDTAKPKCEINPVTVVDCDDQLDTPCLRNVCNPKTAKCEMTMSEQVKLKKCDKKSGQCSFFFPNDVANLGCDQTLQTCDWVLKAGSDPVTTGGPCDDASPCTSGDLCSKGECLPGTAICPCQKNADCFKYEDGDYCNGTMYCGPGGKCQVNPATKVLCPSVDDTACMHNVCDPKDGQCKLKPTELVKLVKVDKATGEKSTCYPTNGVCPCNQTKEDCTWMPKLAQDPSPTDAKVLCDDGDPCTQSEACSAGQCAPEPTSFVCDCTKDADCKDSDGDVCNGVPYCDKSSGKCKNNPATVVVCSTENDTTCAKNTCDKKTGQCAMQPIFGTNVPCTDGNPCTAGDVCEGGKCLSGTNTCDCKADADCAGKEDGNACNGTMYCDKTTSPAKCAVNPATIVSCSSTFDTQCRRNLCHIQTGKCEMTPVAEFQLCSDGNPCTVSETCTGGECVATTNTCSCQADSDCKAQEDGDACNGTLYCDKSKAPFTCKVNPATIVTCPSTNNTACVHNKCGKNTGVCAMTPVPGLFQPCSDGNPCTKGDTCENGGCKPGTNLCECTQDNQCAAKDDADLCNGSLFCDVSVEPFQCKTNPATVVPCSDSGTSECVKAVCTPSTGQCGLVALDDLCNDGNPCTADSCGASGKCVHAAVADGSTCGAGKACSGGTCLTK